MENSALGEIGALLSTQSVYMLTYNLHVCIRMRVRVCIYRCIYLYLCIYAYIYIYIEQTVLCMVEGFRVQLWGFRARIPRS